jgi:TPR repeat protein
MYDKGEGVLEKNPAVAMDWYRKAAQQGFADAQNRLGEKYDDGEVVAQDDTAAMEWFRKAAVQGHAIAQWSVAGYYFFGKVVAEDRAAGEEWLRKAAAQGYTPAAAMLEKLPTTIFETESKPSVVKDKD